MRKCRMRSCDLTGSLLSLVVLLLAVTCAHARTLRTSRDQQLYNQAAKRLLVPKTSYNPYQDLNLRPHDLNLRSHDLDESLDFEDQPEVKNGYYPGEREYIMNPMNKRGVLGLELPDYIADRDDLLSEIKKQMQATGRR